MTSPEERILYPGVTVMPRSILASLPPTKVLRRAGKSTTTRKSPGREVNLPRSAIIMRDVIHLLRWHGAWSDQLFRLEFGVSEEIENRMLDRLVSLDVLAACDSPPGYRIIADLRTWVPPHWEELVGSIAVPARPNLMPTVEQRKLEEGFSRLRQACG